MVGVLLHGDSTCIKSQPHCSQLYQVILKATQPIVTSMKGLAAWHYHVTLANYDVKIEIILRFGSLGEKCQVCSL